MLVVDSVLCCVYHQIKTWIQVMVPKIEDGNNFGVSIQVWARSDGIGMGRG